MGDIFHSFKNGKLKSLAYPLRLIRTEFRFFKQSLKLFGFLINRQFQLIRFFKKIDHVGAVYELLNEAAIMIKNELQISYIEALAEAGEMYFLEKTDQLKLPADQKTKQLLMLIRAEFRFFKQSLKLFGFLISRQFQLIRFFKKIHFSCFGQRLYI